MRPRYVECDICNTLALCEVIYLRMRDRIDGQYRDLGFGTLYLCRTCLRTKPHHGHTGRPRTLRRSNA